MTKDVYEIGEIPPVGAVPTRMHAQLVRPDRYGEPEKAIQDEVIDVPELGPTDALVMVMAAEAALGWKTITPTMLAGTALVLGPTAWLMLKARRAQPAVVVAWTSPLRGSAGRRAVDTAVTP